MATWIAGVRSSQGPGVDKGKCLALLWIVHPTNLGAGRRRSQTGSVKPVVPTVWITLRGPGRELQRSRR
jgi:hypothetical protein